MPIKCKNNCGNEDSFIKEVAEFTVVDKNDVFLESIPNDFEEDIRSYTCKVCCGPAKVCPPLEPAPSIFGEGEDTLAQLDALTIRGKS